MRERWSSRRPIVHALLFAAILAPATAPAQEYPSRPVRFIVGFVPGGIADLMARSLGQKLSEGWGQQVITDNRPGSGGVLSMQITAKAAPDGYTLLLGSSTQFSITPALRSNLPYDPVRDYTPITRIAMTPVILTVQASFPAKSMPELIQVARAKPGQMNYGSPGYGGAPHITAELLKRAAGIDIVHVPFKGGGESIVALLGGHLHLLFGAVSTSLSHVKGGRLRALGVTSAKRSALVPDVPTIAESVPGYEFIGWYSLAAPAKTPAAIVAKVNAEVVSALKTPEFRERFSSLGAEPLSSTQQELAAFIQEQAKKMAAAVKASGAKPE